MAVFPISIALLPVFSPVFCLKNMEPHIQVGFCLIARSQNYTNLPDSWICGRLRVFAGVLRIFSGILRVALGAVMCMYMRWCFRYENGLVCPWDAARMQAMFSQIHNVNCGESVATRKENQAN